MKEKRAERKTTEVDDLTRKRLDLIDRRVAWALAKIQGQLKENPGWFFGGVELPYLAQLVAAHGIDETVRRDLAPALAPGVAMALVLGPRIAKALRVGKTAPVDEFPVRLAKTLCRITGRNWSSYLEQAEKALPEPKGWGRMENQTKETT